MKKLLVSGLLATFFIVAPASVADTSAGASSSAEVIQPLNIVKTADLYFGAFVNSGVALNDTIEIRDTDGVVTYNVSSHFQPIPSEPPHRATFLITGAPGYTVAVTRTATPISLGGGMQVQALDEDPSPGFTLPPGGLTLYVGGRLRVTSPGLVTPGVYSAPFTATVSYE